MSIKITSLADIVRRHAADRPDAGTLLRTALTWLATET